MERGAAGVRLTNDRPPTGSRFGSRKVFVGVGEVSLGKGGVVMEGGGLGALKLLFAHPELVVVRMCYCSRR